jgi:hypothetical protein
VVAPLLEGLVSETLQVPCVNCGQTMAPECEAPHRHICDDQLAYRSVKLTGGTLMTPDGKVLGPIGEGSCVLRIPEPVGGPFFPVSLRPHPKVAAALEFDDVDLSADSPLQEVLRKLSAAKAQADERALLEMTCSEARLSLDDILTAAKELPRYGEKILLVSREDEESLRRELTVALDGNLPPVPIVAHPLVKPSEAFWLDASGLSMKRIAEAFRLPHDTLAIRFQASATEAVGAMERFAAALEKLRPYWKRPRSSPRHMRRHATKNGWRGRRTKRRARRRTAERQVRDMYRGSFYGPSVIGRVFVSLRNATAIDEWNKMWWQKLNGPLPERTDG